MENLVLIRTLKELDVLTEYLGDFEYVAFDTETTGVARGSEIIGFSVAAELDKAFYVILSYWDVTTKKMVQLETYNAAGAFMHTLTQKKLVMHNGVFDCSMVETNYRVSLIESLHTDTMVLAHLLDENRTVGLKDLAVSIYGEESKDEQIAMKASVSANGGVLTRDKYELYKADADLIGKYGAKDAILTFKLFIHLVEELYEQKLDTFFYDEESMPLLRGPTYQLNTQGLKVDVDKLESLKRTLQAECAAARTYIESEVRAHVASRYPGTSKAKTFNIGATKQVAWLLFEKLNNDYGTLTKEGRNVCKALGLKPPYTRSARAEFVSTCVARKGSTYCEAVLNPKTKKMGRPKKVGDYWNYITCGKATLEKVAPRYKWAAKLLEYNKNLKILSTYVEGIQSRLNYGIISPSFLQHGTTSGRYASRNPNFQNLPRDDKRVKSCIVARPGKVFVGADQSQLEPRVFAAVSGDETLINCFSSGEDFYSVVGAPIFEKTGLSLRKNDPESFAKLYPQLRDKSKVIALATPYGRTAWEQSRSLGIQEDEAQTLIDSYFNAYPKVELMMLNAHEQAKSKGVVYSLFGRPRRIPEAMKIPMIYGRSSHAELPYTARNLLNLAMNHPVQSSGASIMNRSAIAIYNALKKAELDASLVMQVHDEVILECNEEDAEAVAAIVQYCMENTVNLNGVKLEAKPTIANNLADLK